MSILSDTPDALDARQLRGPALAAALRDSRATTLARVFPRDDADWRVPQRDGINPVAWELGHLAWFADFWIRRGPHRPAANGLVEATLPTQSELPDAIFDSVRLAHADRWRAPLPGRAALRALMDAQLESCIAAIPATEDDDAAAYFHRLALFHEDMHGEAFAWLGATLGWPAPPGLERMPTLPGDAGAIAVAGGPMTLGHGGPGFGFDNEEPPLAVELAPFEIDATPVRNGAFLCFVEAGGYDQAAHWPGDAGSWRAAQAVAHPARWRRSPGGAWEARWFDRWRQLDLDEPVVHVNAFEAEAYCAWAGRRLPRAAEWECAAAEPGFAWGRSVWEWTADAFRPYPGFRPGPYHDYSQPWFDSHRELRGGALATHARLHDRRYRNFFTAGRNDVFAGFRTAAR